MDIRPEKSTRIWTIGLTDRRRTDYSDWLGVTGTLSENNLTPLTEGDAERIADLIRTHVSHSLCDVVVNEHGDFVQARQ
jgi:hypothetical protein